MGEWMYRSHFLDLGTNWRCGQLHAPVALPLGKEPPVPIREEVGWTPAGLDDVEKIKFINSTGTRTPIPRSPST
jgi:hypothetical protein